MMKEIDGYKMSELKDGMEAIREGELPRVPYVAKLARHYDAYLDRLNSEPVLGEDTQKEEKSGYYVSELEKATLETKINRISGGLLDAETGTKQLLERHPEYQKILSYALELGEIPAIESMISREEKGDYSKLLNPDSELMKKHPEYEAEFNKAILTGKPTALRNFREKLKNIKEGGVYDPYSTEAFLRVCPEYKPELNDAVEEGEPKLLESYLNAISYGDTSSIPGAEGLVEKHPKYEERFMELRKKLEERGLSLIS